MSWVLPYQSIQICLFVLRLSLFLSRMNLCAPFRAGGASLSNLTPTLRPEAVSHLFPAEGGLEPVGTATGWGPKRQRPVRLLYDGANDR